MTIEEILSLERPADIIQELKNKTINVIPWSKLEKEYDKKKHPVYTDVSYQDKVNEKTGQVVKQCRIALGLQKLAVKRIGELCFGIPVKRIYKPNKDNENEQAAASIIEAIFQKNKIDSVNIARSKYLYASCEFATIWYAQKTNTDYAGYPSEYKLRCKTYSPMNGSEIYPLFDDYDDMIVLSIAYSRNTGATKTSYFETFTANRHIRWVGKGSDWEIELDEVIKLNKITGIYQHRDEPIWEDESDNVYEMEWQLSREGNYLRKNLKPKWVVCTSEEIKFGKEDTSNNSDRDVLKYPEGTEAGYKTWDQAIESLRFHIETLRQNFFAQLQLPEMSSDVMKSMPMSAESRKMIFIDAQLKVTDESGLWLDSFYREINVVKAFAKELYPALAPAIDSLVVKVVITPYNIQDKKELIAMYMDGTGGKPVYSQRTAIENIGDAESVEEELQRIADESIEQLGVPTM